MRFMMLYKPGKETTAPPTPEDMARMGALIGEMAKAGVLLATDGLQHSSKGSRVELSSDKFTVTDGPFTETKELIAGYAIIQVKSKDEAIEYAKKFLKAVGQGISEVRQMYDASPTIG
jgi:hypothetical protein